MGNHKNRRAQTPKGRNQAFNEAMREKGRSSAADPIPSKKKYSRKDRRDRSWARGY